VVTRVQAVAPDANWEYCSIHREALAAKGMPDSLNDVLDTTVKMFNFVKARPLYSRVFSALCNDMGIVMAFFVCQKRVGPKCSVVVTHVL
jgi:hypothetical protein